MSEMIWMEHKDLGPDRRQQVTKDSFEAIWANSGWELADPPPEAEVEETAPEDSVDLLATDYPEPKSKKKE